MTKRWEKQLIFFVVLGILFFASAQSFAADAKSLQQENEELKARVAELEAQLQEKNQRSKSPSSMADRSWDPFLEMQEMQEQINRMFQESFGRGGADPDSLLHQTEIFSPQVDFSETPDQYVVRLDIPGMDKDKINLEVKNNTLIVSGERNTMAEEKSPGQYYRRERSFGNFVRTVPLPDDALADKIDAKYENGVLEVKMGRNKAKSPLPKSQRVNIY